MTPGDGPTMLDPPPADPPPSEEAAHPLPDRGTSHSPRLLLSELPILSKKGLKAALRETVIVVLGVLIALWVNNWNERRIDQKLEREYLVRLVQDLRADTAMFRQIRHVAEDKEEHLRIIGPVLQSGAEVQDTVRFLQAVIGSANLSWAHPPVRRTTFQELQNTGDLRLISDADLRVQIISYYFFAADEGNRVDQRRTGYGALSYQVVPHSSYGRLGISRSEEAGGTREAAYLEALPGSERKRLVERVRSAGLVDLIQAEENFARFASQSRAEVQERAIALLNEIDTRIR